LYRVRTAFSGVQGAPWLSTFYFDAAGGTAQQAATAAGVFWGAVDAGISTSVSWATEAEVATVDDATGQITAITTTTPVTGTGGDSNSALPWVVQGLVSWRTGTFVGGREIRGRTYIPGFTEAQSAAGVPEAATRTFVNAAALALETSANAQLVTYSPTKNTSALVSSGSMQTYWAELRSRRD
jgi:hypothetical protein